MSNKVMIVDDSGSFRTVAKLNGDKLDFQPSTLVDAVNKLCV